MGESQAQPAATGDTARVYPRLLGGRLCLNFVNTLDPRASDRPRDFLDAYADLVGWAQYAGALTAAQARDILGASADEPAFAAAIFAQGIDLREAMHRVFLAIYRGLTPVPGDLEAIREAYWTALLHARLAPREGGYEWTWRDDATALERPLWPVARSAVELLTSPEVGRVKECANHGCGWLFLDTSKNGSRRWCSMEGCGSQVKMRRQYARRRALHAPQSPAG
jgi:predicted RNA-binding Zn ribbon-like protein